MFDINNIFFNLILNRIYFQDVYGVTIGGVLGHALCTGLAVLGGRFIAQKISVRTGKLLFGHDFHS